MKKLFTGLFCLYIVIIGFNYFKPLPYDLDMASPVYQMRDIEFFSDLSYQKAGEPIRQQSIFAEVFKLIDEAQSFVVMDMFLFNDLYEGELSFPPLSKSLVDKLLSRKKRTPSLNIVVITDELNSFYNAYAYEPYETLRDAGVPVILTNTIPLRDSSAFYSAVWRMFFGWFGTPQKGWLKNPVNPSGPKGTIRSSLKLLNFKANHRKLIVTDQGGMILSANPHDASAHHSNIALRFGPGPIIKDILRSEQAVLRLSQSKIQLPFNREWPSTRGPYGIQFLTEKAIKRQLLKDLAKLESDDEIWMGMFYLSDQQIVHSLVEAAKRHVDVRLILDPNKDAFGKDRGGIPNRPMANDLVKKANGQIRVRWYDTHGEQYHTKLIYLRGKNAHILYGGSANLTRRNIENYNLEADLRLILSPRSQFSRKIKEYFERLWSNKNGVYTVSFLKYKEASNWAYWQTFIQELTGFSTF